MEMISTKSYFKTGKKSIPIEIGDHSGVNQSIGCQPVCHGTLVCHRPRSGVPRRFSENSDKKGTFEITRNFSDK